MKTEEEWAHQTGVTSDDGAMIYTVKEIKQIQLDAMKEGMQMATLEIQKHFSVHDLTALQIEQAILSAAEQLTEKDL